MVDRSETCHWTELACPLCGERADYEIIEELAGTPAGLSDTCECGAEIDIGAAYYMVTATKDEEEEIEG